MDDEYDDWADTPEAKMFRDKAREDERWAAYCKGRIERLWRDLPILGSPLIWVSPRWMQQKYKLRRWH